MPRPDGIPDHVIIDDQIERLAITLEIARRLPPWTTRIVFEGTPAELAANAAIRKEGFEV